MSPRGTGHSRTSRGDEVPVDIGVTASSIVTAVAVPTIRPRLPVERHEPAAPVGSVGGMEIGELTFTIWDAAVPALPLGGVVLLGALLLWRACRRHAGQA